jgi:hypothetical protein
MPLSPDWDRGWITPIPEAIVRDIVPKFAENQIYYCVVNVKTKIINKE